jgi:hypothetical protein
VAGINLGLAEASLIILGIADETPKLDENWATIVGIHGEVGYKCFGKVSEALILVINLIVGEPLVYREFGRRADGMTIATMMSAREATPVVGIKSSHLSAKLLPCRVTSGEKLQQILCKLAGKNVPNTA